MQLDLTDDQALFRDTSAAFIEAELPVAETRKLHESPAGYDRDWLRRSAELGWFAMLVPEADGGGSVSGRPLIDATIVAELVGRHVQPGPFIPMNVVAAAIAAAGSAAIAAVTRPPPSIAPRHSACPGPSPRKSLATSSEMPTDSIR